MGVASYTSPLEAEPAPRALDRLQRYVRIDTQSRRDRDESPSTPGQLELGRLLVSELREAGLSDAELDEHGYVMETLSASGDGATSDGVGSTAPVIGLIAHLDTSPDAPGAGVEPMLHRSYDGGLIK